MCVPAVRLNFLDVNVFGAVITTQLFAYIFSAVHDFATHRILERWRLQQMGEWWRALSPMASVTAPGSIRLQILGNMGAPPTPDRGGTPLGGSAEKQKEDR